MHAEELIMLTVHLTLPQGDLTAERKERLIERVTATGGDLFDAENQQDVRSFVMVHIGETAPNGYALTGQMIA
jgi:phenylpyruvate tautomerase PptA (4-oxalocrotonate tautomerase family)